MLIMGTKRHLTMVIMDKAMMTTIRMTIVMMELKKTNNVSEQ